MNLIFIIVPVVIVVLAVVVSVLNKQRAALKTANLGLSSDLIACRSNLSRYSGIADAEAEAIKLVNEANGAAAAITSLAEKTLEQAKSEAEKIVADAKIALAAASAAVAKAKQRREQLEADYQLKDGQLDSEFSQKKTQLETEYQAALTKYNALRDEVGLVEENLEDISFGLYKPHFTFQTSEEYKTELTKIHGRVSAMLKASQAATCSLTWTVGNSKRDGERMVKQTTKVILRAFNGECEAALSDVTWSNIDKMEARVQKSFDAVNKLGEVLHIEISRNYLNLRLSELRLAYEYETKKYQEKEEQRAIREKMREEQKATQEIEEAEEEAISQEELYQTLLTKARKEAAEATGALLQELTNKVATFEAKLDEARAKKERAVARAEQTKSGFVYVISNIGAFGQGVFKIGMTRRIEPMERIAELSGASVPFPFDLHAMMFSRNAPELETALHHFFDERKLNLVNARKEFYHNVDLSEIKDFVKSKGLSAEFTDEPEARQYRETLAKRAEKQEQTEDEPKFAESLF
jgi:chromosome segregation ATPase